MSDKYLFVPYNRDIVDIMKNENLIIVDELQKTVIQKMIDERIYNDGVFISFDDIIDLTKGEWQ